MRLIHDIEYVRSGERDKFWLICFVTICDNQRIIFKKRKICSPFLREILRQKIQIFVAINDFDEPGSLSQYLPLALYLRYFYFRHFLATYPSRRVLISMSHKAIAIVGISAELPSGTYSESNLDHSSFWEFLIDAGESYERIPSTRFDIETWKGKGIGQIAVEKGSFLKDIDLFDHVEFGISSRDAHAMAPVTRKLLENTFLALLDSGIEYRKQPVGCYMSGNSVELPNDEYGPRGSFAGATAMVANRVSNHLDLLGPSVPVDTACSSSLTALHLAVQAILMGDCKAAVVGGCQINHRGYTLILIPQASLIGLVIAKVRYYRATGNANPSMPQQMGIVFSVIKFNDSYIPFSFGRAEACVAIVIKLLEDAIKDHDRIYATIRGTSTNSTGSGGPPGAPVAEAQRQAMTLAFERAERIPSEVAYVELHATGTAKRDPTEANWAGQHFRRLDSEKLLIGSVKGNIGHTEIAAFLVSLSKVVSIFEHQIIPPNVNLRTLNPAIKWQDYNLCAPTQPTPLPLGTAERPLISIASSGIGGSNGHVVLEGPPTPFLFDRSEREVNRPVLVMAAGLSPRSASMVAEQLSAIFETAPRCEYAAASTVLGRRSKQMNWRSYGVLAAASLQFSSPQYSGRDANPLVFVFSGQGPQHENMGRELFSTFPAFRDSVLQMDIVFQRKTNKSIIDDYGLFSSGSSPFQLPTVWPIALTLPAIAIFQIAFFDLLVYLGVCPDGLLGHSAGETAVLYASGAASKEMAVELAIIRGQIFSTLETSGGTMAALSCSLHDAEGLLARHNSTAREGIVEVACLNAPSAVAISGHELPIDAVLELAQREGIFGRKIRTRVPIHSSMMDACQDMFRAEVQDLFARYPGDHVPKISTYSTLTGSSFLGPFDAEYFWLNTRSQVLFAPTVLNLGPSTFIEIAPHPVLSSYLSEMASPTSTVLSAVRRPKAGSLVGEYHDMLQFLGKLTVAGHNCVDFTLLNSAACAESCLRLPVYPFLKKRFPLSLDRMRDSNLHHGPINHSRLKINCDTHPTLAEHVIRGEPIWPASGFLEMALEFGATSLFNINFRAMLPMSAEVPVSVNVTLDGLHWKVASRVPDVGGGDSVGDRQVERVHADGYLTFEAPPVYADLNIPEIRDRCDVHVDSEIYPSLSYFSSYGPKFQRITNLYYNSDEALGSIRGMDGSLTNVGEIILHQPLKAEYFPHHVYSHVQLTSWLPESMRFDITIVDDHGKRLCTLRDLEVAKHHITPLREISSPLHIIMQPVFNDCKSGISPGDATPHLPARKPDGENLNFDASISALQLLNTNSRLTANADQRLIRICILGDVARFFSRIKEFLSQFPHAEFELVIPESSTFRGEIVEPFAVLRRAKSLSNADDFFDIVISVGWTDSADFDSLLAACDEILLPGGTLVLTDLHLNSSDPPLPVSDSGFESLPTFDTTRYKAALEQMGYSNVRVNYFPTSDPCHCTINTQKGTWNSDQPALLGRNAFVFTYECGDELKLQRDFSGLNSSQELEIWIVALEGEDAAAGLCLTRALRREYLFWNIRFVSFPRTFSNDMRMDRLRMLPPWLKTEPDIIISPAGEPLIIHTFPSTNFSAFGAVLVEVNPHIAEFPIGSFVVSLQQPPVSVTPSPIDLGSTCVLPSEISLNKLVEYTPALVISVLAPGISTYNRPYMLRALSVLITHCDTDIGSAVCEIYSGEDLKFARADRDVSMLDLTRIPRGTLDLIISGYVDNEHAQLLRTLLRPSSGKLFLWNHELPRIIQEDPCSVGDALRVAVSRSFPRIAGISGPVPSVELDALVCPLAPSGKPQAVFDAQKSYIILGGIGSLGAAVALFMVQRGARHIVVTSRSGGETLRNKNNLIARRIFAYLKSLQHLDVTLAAVDGTCAKSMATLFKTIDREIGGCLILSAILADGLFPTLGEREFTDVLASKIGVLTTLLQTIETSTLEFIVAFSSVTSVVGTGGQTNYCVANGALEHMVGTLPNGFAFICPGIVDSVFMQWEHSRLKHLLDWSTSTDEMILWLDDAIGRYQQGARFHRYMPSLNWEALDRTHGMPKLGKHLVYSVQDLPDVEVTGEFVAAKMGQIIRNVLNISEGDFDPDVPLTSYGIDSLSAGRLSFALRSMVEVTQLQLLADVSLTDVLRKFLRQDSAQAERTKVPEPESIATHTLMDDLVGKFTDGLRNLAIDPISPLAHQATARHTVLLTGSTGALGCHLLAHLLEKDNIQHVYALNRRSPDGLTIVDRQTAALQKQGLPTHLACSEKLTLIVGDLGDVDLGISFELMDKLRSSVTHIIHNAWRIDLMARLSEFEDLILSTHRLLEFAIKSNPIRPSLSFISTIGIFRNLDPSIAFAPESPIENAKIAAQVGYTESKWVAERMVQIAVERRQLNANVIRVGQLSGSDSGSWDTAQWIPALVQSGVYVGCLPDGTGDDPTDSSQGRFVDSIGAAAAAILDMQDSMNDTFHLIHPRPTTWRRVMEPLTSALDVPLVPYAEWFARLKSTADFTPQVPGAEAKSPAALKLLDFFQGGLKPQVNWESVGLLPKLASQKGTHASETLRNVPPLGPRDIESWGFLDTVTSFNMALVHPRRPGTAVHASTLSIRLKRQAIDPRTVGKNARSQGSVRTSLLESIPMFIHILDSILIKPSRRLHSTCRNSRAHAAHTKCKAVSPNPLSAPVSREKYAEMRTIIAPESSLIECQKLREMLILEERAPESGFCQTKALPEIEAKRDVNGCIDEQVKILAAVK
ncbi:putative polyketide synthase [Mycena sanguinolenta]|nr:putative polyketide synthase [Mycena sanguinolenta]